MILDKRQANLVAEVVIDALLTEGFEPAESIPGLVDAIVLLAEQTTDPEQALDEAANLLADTGVE